MDILMHHTGRQPAVVPMALLALNLRPSMIFMDCPAPWGVVRL